MPKEKPKRIMKLGEIEVYPCYVVESCGDELEVSEDVFNRFIQLHNEYFDMQDYIKAEFDKKRKAGK